MLSEIVGAHDSEDRPLPLRYNTVKKLTGFGFDREILFLARRLGFRVEGVPVSFCDQPGSKVRVLEDGFRMLLDIFKIKRIHQVP